MHFSDTLTKIVQHTMDVGRIPFLVGEPGIGKSSFMEDLATANGTKCFTLQCNLLAAKEDITGARLLPTEDGSSFKQSFFPHEVIVDAIEYAEANPHENPSLFLDELNRTTSDVTSALLGIPTARRIGNRVLPENLRVVIAGNDQGNVTSMDDASLSRFALFTVEPDAKTLMGILGSDLNPWVKKVLTKHPALVFQKPITSGVAVDSSDDDDSQGMMLDLADDGEEMNQITTPRTIEAASRWLNEVPRDEINEYFVTETTVRGREMTLLQEILTGLVGDTAFTTQLLETIGDDLASGIGNSSGQTQITVPRPAIFADLLRAASIDELNALISGTDDHERSAALLFALHDSADHERLLSHLALQVTQIERDHMQTLVQMVMNSQYSRSNMQAFIDGNSQIAQMTSPMISPFM